MSQWSLRNPEDPLGFGPFLESSMDRFEHRLAKRFAITQDLQALYRKEKAAGAEHYPLPLPKDATEAFKRGWRGEELRELERTPPEEE